MAASTDTSCCPAERARVYLIAVQSLDGFITQGDQAGTAFASRADQRWFHEALTGMDSVVMGSATYRAAREPIRRQLSAARPRYICTRNPAAYAGESADGLIFTDASPSNLIAEISSAGGRNVGLLGGGQTNARFLRERCVDEFWITIEPLVFGQGTPLAPGGSPLELRVLSHQWLSRETLMLKYAITAS